MNTNFIEIIKRIIAEQGEDILADAQRVKGLVQDYAARESKIERLAFGRCIEYGAYTELKNAEGAVVRQAVKAAVAQKVHSNEGMDIALCNDALDVLEAAVFGAQYLCKKCGKELKDGWKACPFCGAGQTVPEQADYTPQQYQQTPQYQMPLPPQYQQQQVPYQQQMQYQMPPPQVMNATSSVTVPLKKRKSLLVALITGIVTLICIEIIYVGLGEWWRGEFGFFIFALILWCVPGVFNILALKEKKRAFVLVAAIFYTILMPAVAILSILVVNHDFDFMTLAIISMVGILTALIICWINFAKWKKWNGAGKLHE
jgi:rubrerythrin